MQRHAGRPGKGNWPTLRVRARQGSGAGIDNASTLRETRRPMSKPALGRGLGALLGGAAAAPRPAPLVPALAPTPSQPTGVIWIPIDRIQPCAFQPRKDFTPDALRELADSIREHGIVQPLLVRPAGDRFELIAGERRWRAARLAGLVEVPAVVREADDTTVLELALVENLQRENLHPLEEARGFQQLIDQFHLRQEDIASKVGKSRAAVANSLRLLKLVPAVQTLLQDGQLSPGHAKALLGLADAELQTRAANRVTADGLNVRQTEELVARLASPLASSPSPGAVPARPMRDVHVVAVERRLEERFGTKVTLRYRLGSGSVEIRYHSDEELDRILQVAGVPAD